MLSTLLDGSNRLNDGLRQRTTQTYFVHGAYSISNEISIEGFFPIVRQTRKIYNLNGVMTDFDSTFGTGDPYIIILGQILKSPASVRIGGGPQIPFGSSSQKNDQGLTLTEDLQPGSGSWDIISFGSVEFTPGFWPASSWYINFIYSFNGNNPTSRSGAQVYHFGNEFQVISGLSGQILVADQLLIPGIGIRYRKAKRDEIDHIQNTSTGGEWCFGNVSLKLPFAAESSFSINYEFPIHSFVNETQLTPTRRFTFSLYKSFLFKRKNNVNSDYNINF